MKEKHWLILAAVLLAVGAVELYLWQAGQEETATPPTPVNPLDYYPRLGTNEIAPVFEADEIGGGRVRVDYPTGGGKTLLFVLSLTCGTCAKNVPYWNRLARETAGQVRIYGLVVDRFEYQRELALLKEKALEFPALRFNDKDLMLRYKVTKVPHTILVGPGGRVEKSFVGALDDDQFADLLARAKTSAEGTS
jgi:hypothetical protein